MSNKDFRRTLTYGSAALVAIVALVFGTEQSAPDSRAHANFVARPIATPGHTDPWALSHPAAGVGRSLIPRDDYEPEPAFVPEVPSDPTAGEPNHRDRLPHGGVVGEAPGDGDRAADAPPQ